MKDLPNRAMHADASEATFSLGRGHSGPLCAGDGRDVRRRIEYATS